LLVLDWIGLGWTGRDGTDEMGFWDGMFFIWDVCLSVSCVCLSGLSFFFVVVIGKGSLIPPELFVGIYIVCSFTHSFTCLYFAVYIHSFFRGGRMDGIGIWEMYRIVIALFLVDKRGGEKTRRFETACSLSFCLLHYNVYPGGAAPCCTYREASQQRRRISVLVSLRPQKGAGDREESRMGHQ